jgi:hypothetical protein
MALGQKSVVPPSLIGRRHTRCLRANGPSVLLLRRDPMSKYGERGRDAGTGQFIPVKEAERRKKTAIVERFKKDKDGRPLN